MFWSWLGLAVDLLELRVAAAFAASTAPVWSGESGMLIDRGDCRR